MYVLEPCGSLQDLSCEAGSFSCCHSPHRCFQSEVFEALFSHTGTLGWAVSFAPQLFLLVYQLANVGQPALPDTASPNPSGTILLTPVLYPLPYHNPLHPSCPSPPLLPVWLNVFSLTPWLSDFHTVRFSASFGYFLL